MAAAAGGPQVWHNAGVAMRPFAGRGVGGGAPDIKDSIALSGANPAELH